MLVLSTDGLDDYLLKFTLGKYFLLTKAEMADENQLQVIHQALQKLKLKLSSRLPCKQ